MTQFDDRGTPDSLRDDEGGDGRLETGAAEGYGHVGRGEEVLDTRAAEAGSPSRGEGLSDDELVEMVRDPDHRA